MAGDRALAMVLGVNVHWVSLPDKWCSQEQEPGIPPPSNSRHHHVVGSGQTLSKH